MARSICLALALAFAALLCATAARAQSWDDGNWAGEDELSAGAPASGYADDQGDYVADSGPSMNDFHQGLDQYGRWIDTAEYGTVWQPADAAEGASFRPYYSGRWVYSTSGWTWVSDEPYGWAVYHYGRWASLGSMGWVWLPGRVWGPAWVTWRWGGGYAGWAPLGPSGGIYDEPGYYVFVDQPHFLSPVPQVASAVTTARVIWTRAVALPVSRPGPRAGPVATAVARATGTTVRALPVVDSDAPRARVANGVVQLYRPRSVGIPVRVAQPQREGQSEPRAVEPQQQGWGAQRGRGGGPAGENAGPPQAARVEQEPPGRGQVQGGQGAQPQGAPHAQGQGDQPHAKGLGGQQHAQGQGAPAHAQGQGGQPQAQGAHAQGPVQSPPPPPHAQKTGNAK